MFCILSHRSRVMVRAGKQHRRVHFERREHRQRGNVAGGGNGGVIVRRHVRVFFSLSLGRVVLGDENEIHNEL